MHYNSKINKKTQFSVHHGIKHVKDENNGINASTTVDTATIEIRRDINKRWDIGLHGGYLHDWNGNTMETVAGISVGANPAKNAWAELGYNFEGFDDDDFDKSNFKRKGPYVDFRYKFNQDTIKGDLVIRRKVNANAAPKAETDKVVNKKETKTAPVKQAPVKEDMVEETKQVTTQAVAELETIDQLFSQYASENTSNKISTLNNDK